MPRATVEKLPGRLSASARKWLCTSCDWFIPQMHTSPRRNDLSFLSSFDGHRHRQTHPLQFIFAVPVLSQLLARRGIESVWSRLQLMPTANMTKTRFAWAESGQPSLALSRGTASGMSVFKLKSRGSSPLTGVFSTMPGIIALIIAAQCWEEYLVRNNA
jgi:hypothetical protein